MLFRVFHLRRETTIKKIEHVKLQDMQAVIAALIDSEEWRVIDRILIVVE